MARRDRQSHSAMRCDLFRTTLLLFSNIGSAFHPREFIQHCVRDRVDRRVTTTASSQMMTSIYINMQRVRIYTTNYYYTAGLHILYTSERAADDAKKA